jgi:hypothetical protein
MENPSSTPRRWWNRRLIRLSLRMLMLLVLVLAGGLGWVVHRARVQRDAVAAIEKTGGRVVYHWQKTPAGTTAVTNLKAEPPWPKWLVGHLGVDYFGHVELAFLGEHATDDTMAHLGRLPRLEGMTVRRGSGVTDAGVAHLRDLVELNTIDLNGSNETLP